MLTTRSHGTRTNPLTTYLLNSPWNTSRVQLTPGVSRKKVFLVAALGYVCGPGGGPLSPALCFGLISAVSTIVSYCPTQAYAPDRLTFTLVDPTGCELLSTRIIRLTHITNLTISTDLIDLPVPAPISSALEGAMAQNQCRHRGQIHSVYSKGSHHRLDPVLFVTRAVNCEVDGLLVCIARVLIYTQSTSPPVYKPLQPRSGCGSTAQPHF